MPEQWQVSFPPGLMQLKYKIPHGEAAVFRDAVSILYSGPQPDKHQAVAGFEDVYEYEKNGYRIRYQIIWAERKTRIVFFDVAA